MTLLSLVCFYNMIMFGSVSDPDPSGHICKLPLGSGSVFDIRIRIQQGKLGYKNPLFMQIFHDFHLIIFNLKMYVGR